MIDTHYDLLTILYCCYLKDDFSYIEKIKEDLTSIDGLVTNLYFMSKSEMKKELEIDKIDVFEMFKISTNLFKDYFGDKRYIFSIEGCDYIEDTKELENLYRLGLRNILLVWNNENKYGSGNRSSKGLTELGEEFIRKAVDLGISIDLSHMNKNTFWDTIDLLNSLKANGKKIRVIASHSNSYALCKNKRNLEDSQLEAIAKLGGMVGLVSYGPFISLEREDLAKKFLEHVKYIEKLVGIDNIMISTDNMDFATDLYGIEEDISLFNHKTVKSILTKLLSSYYNKEEIEKILIKNAERYFEVSK